MPEDYNNNQFIEEADGLDLDFLQPIQEEINASQAPAIAPGTVNIFAGTGEHAELSNFAIRPFIAGVGVNRYPEGVALPYDNPFFNFDSVEQAFQFAKTLYSKGPEEQVNKIRETILETTDGAELRKLGRELPGLDRRAWDADSAVYMEYFIRQSFSRDEEARQALLATGDAVLTHEQDNSRWRTEFPRILTDIRSDLREGRSVSRNFNDIAATPHPITETPENAGLTESAKHYDILTLGTGKRSEEEFYSLIPPGTTMIVDTRSWRKNSQYAHFDVKSLEPGITSRGIKYDWMRSLSGKDARFPLNGNKKLSDWRQVENTDEFRQAFAHLNGLVEAGEKVVILSGEANPAYGHRAKLLGQLIEASTGRTVGHINTDREGNPVITSNRDVIERSLGPGAHIQGGSYVNLHFNSDGSYLAEDGVEVNIVRLARPAEERLIYGNWNYGQKVSIRQIPKDADVDGADITSFKATQIENARDTDITVVFSIGTLDRSIKQAKDAAAGRVVTVNIQDSRLALEGERTEFLSVKELLQSPEYIDKVSTQLRDKINRNLAVRTLGRDNPGFDLENLKVNIAGSHIAHIVNELAVTTGQEDLTGQDLAAIAAGGLHVETNEISQEDVNEFMREVISRVQRPVISEEFAEGKDSTFHISEIRTNGQTGVAEAAILAAQSLGIKASILAPNGFGLNIDNETTQGLFIKDETMFKNRFHQGLKNEVTRDTLVEGVQRQRDEDRIREESSGLSYGLSDRQILTLQRIGFSNTDLVTMAEIADNNRTIIGNDGDMQEFVELCGGYGIGGTEFVSEELIARKRSEVDDLIQKAAEQGIGFITLNNSHYPENLRQMDDTSHVEYDERVVTHDIDEAEAIRLLDGIYENGVLHTENIPQELIDANTVEVERIPRTVTERRPAILWYKGDISLIGSASVTLHGDFVSMEKMMEDARKEKGHSLSSEEAETVEAEFNEAVQAKSNVARNMGEQLAKDDVTAITSTTQGPAVEAANETIAKGGRAVVVSADPVDGPEMDGLKENTVRNGGVVVSENAPGDNEVKNKDAGKRAERIASAMGYANTLIVGVSNARANNEIEQIALDSLGIGSALTFGLFDLVAGKVSASQKKKTEEVGTGELGKVTESARNAHGTGADEALSHTEGFRPERGTEGPSGLREEHPKQCPVSVMCAGKERVFFVAENLPDVREAVKARYGSNAIIADPKDRDRLFDRYSHKTVSVDGETLNAFEGYRGTQPQEKEPFFSTMYYVNGKLESLLTAPNTTLGLLPIHERKNNAILFQRFKNEAKQIQMGMQREVGLNSKRAFRFENADYLVIKNNSVEVRRGDEIRAVVSINQNGEIKISNSPLMATDLEEHGGRQYPVFTQKVTGVMDEARMSNVLEELRACIEDRCVSEADALSQRAMNEGDEVEREIQDGFLKIREDNKTVAANDVMESQRLGIISDGNGEPISRTEAMAYLLRDINNREKGIKAVDAEINKGKKALESEGLTPEEKETIENRLDVLQGKKLEALAKLTYIKSHKADIAIAEDITLVTVTGKDGKEQKGVDIEGLLIPVSGQMKLSDKLTVEAEKTVRKLESYYESMGRGSDIDSAAVAHSAAVEAEKDKEREAKAAVPEKSESVTVKEEKKEDRTGLKATKEDVIGDLTSGSVIVNVAGKKAIADKDLNVRSEVFEDIRPAGKAFCYGIGDSGKFKLLYPNGEAVLPVWLESITKAENGVSTVKSEGMYNKLELSSGKLVSERWIESIGQTKDGWALVKDHGKFNYMSSKGELMTPRWFDSATEFSSGLAVISRGDKSAKINNKGAVLEMLEKGMGGPGRS